MISLKVNNVSRKYFHARDSSASLRSPPLPGFAPLRLRLHSRILIISSHRNRQDYSRGRTMLVATRTRCHPTRLIGDARNPRSRSPKKPLQRMTTHSVSEGACSSFRRVVRGEETRGDASPSRCAGLRLLTSHIVARERAGAVPSTPATASIGDGGRATTPRALPGTAVWRC